MKNRMREIRTSGSVRGEGGNPLRLLDWPGPAAVRRGPIMQNEAKLGQTGVFGGWRSRGWGDLAGKWRENEPNVRQDKLGKEDVHGQFVSRNLL